jgi:hypothetical protein
MQVQGITDYITLTEAEFRALQEQIIEADDVASIQLSRRDSLDNPYDQGFLIVSVVPKDGEQFRVAIGETGSITAW